MTVSPGPACEAGRRSKCLELTVWQKLMKFQPFKFCRLTHMYTAATLLRPPVSDADEMTP